MSTYYFLICETHREAMGAATTAGSNYMAHSDITLGPFVLAHCKCQVRIASEHELDRLEDSGERFEHWDDETLDAMRQKAAARA